MLPTAALTTEMAQGRPAEQNPKRPYDNIRLPMKDKTITAAVVGLVVGFILGFFLARIAGDQGEPVQTATAPTEGSEVPKGHPPAEVLEKLAELQSRAASNPKDKEIRIVLGNLYYDMGRFDAAINWYDEAIQLDPSDVNVSTDLGTSYLYSGNSSRAIALYEKSLALEPDHLQTLQNLGFAYFSIEKFAEAAEIWNRLIDRHPDYPHASELKKQIQEASQRAQRES